MAYDVLWHKRARKELQRLPRDVAARLVRATARLADDPMGASLPLSGSRFRRVRAGDHRAIVEVDHDARAVRVLLVAHRKNAYKGMLEL
jgi:mRNA interferase RelE/StbE